MIPSDSKLDRKVGIVDSPHAGTGGGGVYDELIVPVFVVDDGYY